MVGSPVLPMGSWSSHGLRSKLPPGAQLGFRAVIVEAKGRRRSISRVFEGIGLIVFSSDLEKYLKNENSKKGWKREC